MTGPLQPHHPPNEDQPGEPPKRVNEDLDKFGAGCLWFAGGVTVLMMVILFVAYISSLFSDSEDDAGLDAASAEVACEDFVRDRLKAPSTAQFSNASAMPDDGDGQWTVTGDINAENSFGASIRSSYECVIQLSEDEETWNLVSLTGLG